MYPLKATNEQLLELYERLGNIWKVALELGMCGQSVWERLKKLGIEDKDKWTDAQLELLYKAYSIDTKEPLNINDLAKSIGKLKSSVSGKARRLGLLTSRTRKRTDLVRIEMGERLRQWIKKHGPSKGAYKTGKEIRLCLRCNRFFEVFPSSRQKYCGMECGHNHSQSYGHQGYAKTGKRNDLNGQYFRSTYEANYARYLNFLKTNGVLIDIWDFEPTTFEFKTIKKGVRFYTPDFRVQFSDGHIEYHEVKGWDYPKGIIQRKRFAKYFPHLKLVLISKEFFKDIKISGIDKLILGWE